MPVSREDMDDIKWKMVHLCISESPPFQNTAPDGFDFQESPFDTSLDTYFKIEQKETWDSMSNFERCKINTQYYCRGDIVYVNNKFDEILSADDIDGTEEVSKDFWVANILEIKAADDTLVLARVVWLYWPEDLPMARDNHKAAKGRRSYHGEEELIASNHMDIVSVCTFAGTLQVQQWTERDEEMKVEGTYWRQLFDVRNKHLSKLRRHCGCGLGYNPNKLVLACPSCKVWLHYECVIEDTLLKTYRSMIPADIVVPVEDKRKRKRRQVKRKPKSPWADMFIGQIIQSENGQPPKVEVTELHPSQGDEAKRMTDISCLKCRTTFE